MISYHKGNLFSSNPSYILHGCNCQGVMGAGFAREIRNRYPNVFHDYRQLCAESESDEILLGNIQVVRVIDELTVLNAFTQLTCGNVKGHRYVSYDAVATVFHSLADYVSDKSCYVDMPKICAGLGGADWNVIESIIKSETPDWLNIRVWEL